MKNTERLRDVTVFGRIGMPRTIQIPESLIQEFEEKANPFTETEASALLASEGCNEHTLMNYTDEEMANLLISIMKEEIEIMPQVCAGFEAYILAGEPDEFKHNPQ